LAGQLGRFAFADCRAHASDFSPNIDEPGSSPLWRGLAHMHLT
jgi:hypothetical protein